MVKAFSRDSIWAVNREMENEKRQMISELLLLDHFKILLRRRKGSLTEVLDQDNVSRRRKTVCGNSAITGNRKAIQEC